MVEDVVPFMAWKGGTGKTTMAVNTALMLAQKYRVGLLDADTRMPNVARYLGLLGSKPDIDKSMMSKPLKYKDLLVYSLGAFVPTNIPITLDGSDIEQHLRQTVMSINWGKLDILIVDFPPNTIRELETMISFFPHLTGVVMVTTSEDQSLDGVRRLIKLCRKWKIKVIGLAHNMNGAECMHCGGLVVCQSCKKSFVPFNPVGAKSLAEDKGIKYLGSIPFNPGINRPSGKIMYNKYQVFRNIGNEILRNRHFFVRFKERFMGVKHL